MKFTLANLLLCAFLIMGCENKPPKKPFVITHKFPQGARCNQGYCSYEYTDANGKVVHFCEEGNRYNIGDTIK